MLPFVLFLDFDGVLHPRTSGTVRHAPALERLLAKHPQVLVVVSSTWKHSNSVADLRGWFSRDFAPRVVAVTPDLPHGVGSRQREIEAWLRANPAKQWLALDDEPRLFEPNCPWLYLTNTADGLTASDLEAIDAVLAKAK
jgi:hypothetical protein